MFLDDYSNKMKIPKNEFLLQNTYNKKLFSSIDVDPGISGELNFSQKYLSPFIGIFIYGLIFF